MTTTFKVGDRVRLTGERFGPMRDEIVRVDGEDLRGFYFFRKEARWYVYKDGDHSAELYEPAPPPDTRKRLREYTDLADGDVAVIAGVPFTVDGDALISGEQYIWTTRMPWAAMLVDEVRRKPRTKKRRVYEEIEKAEAMIGDILVTDGEIPYVYDGDESDLDGGGIFRFIEETEVPR